MQICAAIFRHTSSRRRSVLKVREKEGTQNGGNIDRKSAFSLVGTRLTVENFAAVHNFKIREAAFLMKATGIVRKVDELGRIVLPSELRKTMHVTVGDSFELYTYENTVVLKKYEPGCVLTGTMEDLIEYRGHKISKLAIKEMAETTGLL